MATDDKSLQKRTIVILGKPGVGKATIANEILGERKLPVSTTVGGMTRALNPVQIAEKRDTDKGYSYKIYVIDVDSTSTSAAVREDLKECDGVNLVLLVFKSGRFTNEEKELFHTILDSIPKAAEISGLVVTTCEDLSEHARRNLVEDFKSNKHTASIASKLQKGILTVGFPNLEAVRPELKDVYSEDVENDRDKLHTLIQEDCRLLLPYHELFDSQSHSTRDLLHTWKQCKIL